MNDNQLIGQFIGPAFDPYAQSNVQKSQCGFNNYVCQTYNVGSYGFIDNSVQKSDMNLQTILDTIYVFDGGSSSAGTLFYHSVDFLNIWNDFGKRLQQLMYVHPTPGSVCSGFYHLQYECCLHECCQVPSGQMCVMGSGSIPIHMVCVYKNDAELLCNPKVAYENYL